MQIFIFHYVDQLTNNYHPGGGLVVIARNEEHVREMVAEDKYIDIIPEEWDRVKVYPTMPGAKPEIIIFADAGCC